MKREHAFKLKEIMHKASASISDSDALQAVELFPVWKSEAVYAVGDRVRYEEVLYKCLLEHTAQTTWTPDVSSSLWVRVDDPSIEFPDWRQPAGSADAYPIGAKVSHLEKHWISDVDNNVWEPSVYGWSEVIQ